MTTQKIFNALGPNWKWASYTSSGTARVHTELPVLTDDGVLFYNRNAAVTARCEAYDAVTPEDGMVPQIWERTNFSNGPDRDTDSFGALIGYAPPPPPPVMPTQQMPAPAPAPMAPPKQTRLTTEEAENGGLWAFANQDEDFVHVNCDGVVWFDLFKDGPKPRRSYAVEVDGVTHVIERTRSQPQLAPPEAGKPFSGAEKPWPSPVQPTEHPHVVKIRAEIEVHAAYVGGQFGEYDKGIANGLELAIALIHGWGTPDYTHTPGRRLDDGDTPDHAYSEAQFAGLRAKIQEVENALGKAKRHASALLSSYQADGNSVALTRLQYTAIFGELPK